MIDNEITFEDLHDLDAPAEDQVPSGPEVVFNEPCSKCGGSGTYGRVTSLGHSKCTRCHGSGKLTFKTSPNQRAKAKASAKARKERKRIENVEALKRDDAAVAQWLLENEQRDAFAASVLEAVRKYGELSDGRRNAVLKNIAKEDEANEVRGQFAKDHPAVLQWLEDHAADGNPFASSLLHGLQRFGRLTDGQIAAVERNLEREGAKENNLAASPSDIDLSSLPAGTYAVPGGDTRLKVRIRKPGKNSRWHGYIFVDDGAAYGQQRNYGRQAPGGLYRGDIRDQLAAILKDPYEAATAYGKLTGSCCICGRLLEDEQSVAAGIGPICASKF